METPAEPPYHFNPIDVLVEDALGEGDVDNFADYIDQLLKSQPRGAFPLAPLPSVHPAPFCAARAAPGCGKGPTLYTPSGYPAPLARAAPAHAPTPTSVPASVVA